MADAQIEYGGMASEDINDWKELASDILKGTPSIDLEADYVPRDYYNKVVEELCKKHAEEIVRCKECKHFEKNDSILRGEWWCDLWADTIEDDGYCSYGEREGE